MLSESSNGISNLLILFVIRVCRLRNKRVVTGMGIISHLAIEVDHYIDLIHENCHAHYFVAVDSGRSPFSRCGNQVVSWCC